MFQIKTRNREIKAHSVALRNKAQVTLSSVQTSLVFYIYFAFDALKYTLRTHLSDFLSQTSTSLLILCLRWVLGANSVLL